MTLGLQQKEWAEYFLKDIFQEIQRGRRLKKDDHRQGNKPYVSSTSLSNGVDDFIGNEGSVRIFEHCLTVANSGSVGSTFFHPYKFIASDHVTSLKNINYNKYIYRFIAGIIERLGVKYSFNREINDARIKKEKILLPVNAKGKPDYKFMEDYMRQQEREKLDKYREYALKRLAKLKNCLKVKPLDEKKWGEFFIQDVATIESGRDIYAKERICGDTPYVSATSNNNGIGYFVGNNNKTKEAGCLSVNRNGSVGYSFYHPYETLFSNDCRKLRLKYSSKHVGIFVSQQITRQRDKYGYGYKMGTARLKKQKIMLPINKDSQPDYEYMENYMKCIEYEKLKRYSEMKFS